jgi:hypothetical protein
LFPGSTNSADILLFPGKKYQPGLRIPERLPESDNHPISGFWFDIKTNDSYNESKIIHKEFRRMDPDWS